MKLLFDFTDPRAVDTWHAIDDRVMGGLSQSRMRADPAGHAVFEGNVSLDQGGGFASVRCEAADLGLSGAQVCVIELRGQARTFKLGLRGDARFDGLQYQAAFAPTGVDWQILHLPLTAFRAGFRGRDVPGAPALDPARIRQVGLTIAARQAGPFTLDVRRIGLA